MVIGAAVGYFARVPGSVVAGVMAFGSGVLISALSFELMEEAFEEHGLTATVTGFLLGAAIYAAANHLLAIWAPGIASDPVPSSPAKKIRPAVAWRSPSAHC